MNLPDHKLPLTDYVRVVTASDPASFPPLSCTVGQRKDGTLDVLSFDPPDDPASVVRSGFASATLQRARDLAEQECSAPRLDWSRTCPAGILKSRQSGITAAFRQRPRQPTSAELADTDARCAQRFAASLGLKVLP